MATAQTQPVTVSTWQIDPKHSTAEFAMAAKKAGRNYTELIAEIVDLARSRYANV